MKYAKIIDGIVDQVDCNARNGYIKVPDNVVCGMIKTDNGFENPVKSQAELDIEVNENILKKIKDIELNKYPRAMTDAILGDNTYLLQYKEEVENLRNQLVK